MRAADEPIDFDTIVVKEGNGIFFSKCSRRNPTHAAVFQGQNKGHNLTITSHLLQPCRLNLSLLFSKERVFSGLRIWPQKRPDSFLFAKRSIFF